MPAKPPQTVDWIGANWEKNLSIDKIFKTKTKHKKIVIFYMNTIIIHIGRKTCGFRNIRNKSVIGIWFFDFKYEKIKFERRLFLHGQEYYKPLPDQTV
jgi:hypothetical protein